MSYGELEERPTKKRRFFVDDAAQEEAGTQQPPLHDPPPADIEHIVALPEKENVHTKHDTKNFDVETLHAIAGEKLSASTINRLQELSGNDLERAINLYFDGSWRMSAASTPTASSTIPTLSSPQQDVVVAHKSASVQRKLVVNKATASSEAMPSRRYIGSFGVTAWATRSGSGLLSYGETVTLDRVVPQQSAQKTGKLGRMARQDVVVRFKNTKGQEVGRLENETSYWISSMMDQKVCAFEGNCVFAPDRLRTSDTIYLQLKCYLFRSIFENGSLIAPMDDNRQTTFFEAKESDTERALRMRQVGLIKLFEEIKLTPKSTDQQDEKSKRQGLLQAAESAEKKEQSTGKATSSSTSEDEEEGQELEQDQLDSLYKKAQSFDFDTPEAQPAETFTMSLRRYQKQALHWMLSKERDQKADHKEQSMHPLWDEYLWPTKDADDQDLSDVGSQLSFYVNPYSGQLSLEFPVQEQNCLGGILADEMGLGKTIEMLSLIHTNRANLSLANGSSTNAIQNLTRLPRSNSDVEEAPATTLVVAPMSLLAQWQSESEKASKSGSLNIMMYYGSEKTANLQHLCCRANAANAPNVIITSYGVVLSEYSQLAANGGNRRTHGGLFSLEYFRIILDEAHTIKNRQAKTSKACYALRALHRWVLTGTPIVNRLEDLFSLVHFLRVEPWSNFSFWKTFITVPFESKDFLRALDVVQTVLEPLVMRRTKDMKMPNGEYLVPLPPKSIEIEHVELSKSEREFYDYILSRAKRTFAANEANLLKAYTTIFAQILRLRQSCCHPILTRNKSLVADEIEADHAADLATGLADDMDLDVLLEQFEADDVDVNRYGANALKQIQEEASEECPICSEEPMNQQAVTGCWHSACKTCLLEYIEHQKNKSELPRCFNCREPVTPRDVYEVVRHEADGDQMPRISLRRTGAEPSAKIAALVAHLSRIRKDSPGMKSVVFSQFTSFLDLIETALTRERLKFVRFDGSMSQKQRAAVLNDFTNSDKGLVLLLSLKAGGVGLNLTTAKRVFMMDPWWSFAIEAQAIDRVHRMGQEDEVKVVRFITNESIEEKMLRIQERKKFIANSLGMMSAEEKRLQSIEDIKELLS